MTAFSLTGVSLADRKAAAIVQVDAEAEAARLLWITDGAGQAQEYRKTEDQARAYKAAGYPTPFNATTYPMIDAEIQAKADAGLITLSTQAEIDSAAHTATDEIIAEADDWLAAARTIKRYRRRAKLRIDAATTFAQIHAALQITWPTP